MVVYQLVIDNSPGILGQKLGKIERFSSRGKPVFSADLCFFQDLSQKPNTKILAMMKIGNSYIYPPSV
jgi:hypothetical protein